MNKTNQKVMYFYAEHLETGKRKRECVYVCDPTEIIDIQCNIGLSVSEKYCVGAEEVNKDNNEAMRIINKMKKSKQSLIFDYLNE